MALGSNFIYTSVREITLQIFLWPRQRNAVNPRVELFKHLLIHLGWHFFRRRLENWLSTEWNITSWDMNKNNRCNCSTCLYMKRNCSNKLTWLYNIKLYSLNFDYIQSNGCSYPIRPGLKHCYWPAFLRAGQAVFSWGGEELNKNASLEFSASAPGFTLLT